jgi:pimeloyl-ACP methyl ester carboxylesterase
MAVSASAGFAVEHLRRGVLVDLYPVRSQVTPGDRAEAMRLLPGLTDVTLTTRDGIRLAGWYASGANGAAIVLVHGLSANRVQVLPEAARLVERGYGVFAYDARAHGNSEGRKCTWGDRERHDVAAALDFVAGRSEVKRIGAIGFSIGASAVAVAAATDSRLQSIVLEAATPSFRKAVEWDNRRYGPIRLYPTLWLYRWYGVRVDEIDVVAALRTMAPRPVLVVAGSMDQDVVPWMTNDVFAAAPNPKSLYLVPDAGHGAYARAAGDEYLEHLVGFFDATLHP